MNILFICGYELCRAGFCEFLDDLAEDINFTDVANLKEAASFLKNNSVDLIISIFDPMCATFDTNGQIAEDTMLCLNKAEDIAKLHEYGGGTPIVLCTFHESSSMARQAMANGAAAYIPLSSKREVLLNACRLVMAGGRYVPAELFDTPWTNVEASQNIMIQSPASSDKDHLLTPRQRDVLHYMAEGKSNKNIANKLSVTEGTVKVHVAAILKALKASNRTQAVLLANQQNLT